MRWRNFHSPGRACDLRELTARLADTKDNRCETGCGTSRTLECLVVASENEVPGKHGPERRERIG